MAFQFPWTNLHELNLDWMLSKFKQFIGDFTGTTATVELIPTSEQPSVEVTGGELDDDTDIIDPFTFKFKLPINSSGGGAVNSVNGQVGDVVIDKSDLGLGNVDNVLQYSALNPPPYPVTSVNGDTGAVTIDKTDIGLGNVANETQYSANNPPPYPVTSVNGMTGDVIVQGGGGGGDVLSVNGKTGAVVLDKTDIGLGNVANEAQYSANNPPPYPVTSVNGDTGAVVLDKTDIGLGNVANEAQYSANNPPPYPVTSVNGMTGAVTVSTAEQLYMRSVTVASSAWTAGTLTTGSGKTYSYYYEVSIANMTQNDFVDISNMGSASSYTGDFAIQGLTGKFRIWVETQPSSNIAWYVYYTVGMTAQT